jgi:hypothetical protein
MAKKKKAFKPLPTIWNVNDEPWGIVESLPSFQKLDPSLFHSLRLTGPPPPTLICAPW